MHDAPETKGGISLVRLGDLGVAADAMLAALGIGGRHELAEAGAYLRRPPDRLDLAQAQPAVAEQVRVYAKTTAQSHPGIDMLHFRDARVTGQGAVVLAPDALVDETVREFLAHGNVPDGFIRSEDARLQLGVPPSRRIDIPSLLLKRPWYRNFGHFLVDAAAILGLLLDRLPDGIGQIVLGDVEDPVMRQCIRDLCEILAPNVPLIFHPDGETWLFRDLFYVTPVHVPPLFKHPAALAGLRRGVLRSRSIGPGTRRLFIPRRGRTRLLRNQGEIETLLSAQGFETVYPEDLPISAQAVLFAEARQVVGVKGAAMTNIVFCPPRTAVVVLAPGDFDDPFFWDISGQLGHRYAEVFGSTQTDHGAGRNDFVISPDAIAWALAAMAGP